MLEPGFNLANLTRRYLVAELFAAFVSVQARHWVAPQLSLKLAVAALRSRGGLLLAQHQGQKPIGFYT